jgi:hypothetical protein
MVAIPAAPTTPAHPRTLLTGVVVVVDVEEVVATTAIVVMAPPWSRSRQLTPTAAAQQGGTLPCML